MRLLSLLSIVTWVICSSCQQEALTPSAYVNWIEAPDNGLRITQSQQDIAYTLQYRPAPYIILQERAEDLISPEQMDTLTQELGDLQYFSLQLSAKEGQGEVLKLGITNAQDYKQRLRYLVGAMQYDLSLVEAGDTLPCILYHHERNYQLAPHETIILGFAPHPGQDLYDKQLVFKDRLFGRGTVTLTIKANDLGQIPELKL